MDTKFGDFILPWTIAALKFFKENLLTNFGLIAAIVKVVLESTKKAVSLAFDWFTCFHVFSKSRVKPVVECLKVICKTNEW